MTTHLNAFRYNWRLLTKAAGVIALLGFLFSTSRTDAALLAETFRDPPVEARLHAYWWWLNGNVTEAAITRDLEAMREKGFGGALIMDAGGADQDGNRQVPHGPDFASPEWRKLYQHALREARRLDLELGLNIQSGWNLGGPSVTPADAAKILCWTEVLVAGPGSVVTNLPAPTSRHGLLREVAVLALPDQPDDTNGCNVSVSSAHPDYPAPRMCDGSTDTFWVSDGVMQGSNALAWIRLSFDADRATSAIKLQGREGHGPKALEVLAVAPDGSKLRIAQGRPGRDGAWRAAWDKPQTVRQLEIRITEAYDSAAGKPRNVQITEIAIEGPGWQWPARQQSIPNWEQKTLYRPLGFSAPVTSMMLSAKPDSDHSSVLDPATVVDLSSFADSSGKLVWTAPAGRWRVYRFCCTVAPRARVSTASQGWEGLALDPMDAGAFQHYWDAVVEPLMQDAKEVGGKALRFLHTDSWEIEPYNWTERLPEAFRTHCGYDLRPWLPALTGRQIGTAEESERFLHDFRKTVARLAAENHLQPFLDNAHRHGVQVRAESGGPHAVPIDAQHCLGTIDVPMSEFWATSWRHRVTEEARFFVKQPAMAAHTYGRPIVAAEGFTTIGPHWQEKVWDNLKPAFDRALCEGLNQLLWTLVTCSPAEMGLPGQEMFPGTHFNPNSTWWPQSEGFLSYINRCQWMLRQGLFVADVLYYYGDHAPNFAQLKKSNPAALPEGYGYDVATEHVVLNRLKVKNGRMTLPDGMSYAALVLAPHRTISLPVLHKLRELANAGGMIIGNRPESSSGLASWRRGDVEARALVDSLWGKPGSDNAVVRHRGSAEWLQAARLPPDFSANASLGSALDYIHRRAGDAEIYFLANRTNRSLQGMVRFRATGKPELWDPRDGSVRLLPEWRRLDDGCTELPLDMEEFGSCFIVFREAAQGSFHAGKQNFPKQREVAVLDGHWAIAFDPGWFYPDNGTGGQVQVNKLFDWSQSPEPAIRYFSGRAVYSKEFDAPAVANASEQPLALSLGQVAEMARVRLNGRDLGIVWCPPWSVTIPRGLLRPKGNRLEVEVVNFWPNRLIGDTKLPADKRRTRTNITKFENPKGDAHYTSLMPSGLLGPVRLVGSDSK